ncbi:MAG: AAA family ATPase [Thermotogota bacterium]|nr:AAA family ATPase [Thermotogota bacterium]
MKRLPIGISDFKKIIEYDYYFVDTTRMIGDIYRESANIVLITRPRRFGKTLNMSMLRYFYDNRIESSELFKSFAIAEDEEIMHEMNSYPVIYLTFKDVNNNTWDKTYDKLKNLLADLYKDFEEDLQEIFADSYTGQYCRKLLDGTASNVDYQNALKNLTRFLHKVYNKPVILIIDEYDVPIQSGWLNGYYDEIIDMMKGILSGALKDNPHLFKGVLTGIYRVAKESIFSGLNNLKIYTLLKERYHQYFGFTEKEITKILKVLGLEENGRLVSDLQAWYDGYKFGGKKVYNPWSVLNYLYDKELQPYWIGTSSNDLIITLIDKNLKDDAEFRAEIETLIAGDAIEKTINESAALRDIEYSVDAIWALFLFSGYLKPDTQTLTMGKYECALKIPNEEVMVFFRDTVTTWLNKAGRRILSDMTKPLLQGNAKVFCEKLEKYVLETLSYYDIQEEAENTYHILILGMFAHLSDDYVIRLNRESGLGRYDICLKAKDKKNYSAIIEIKARTVGTEKALEQIEEKDYTRELESAGYKRIMKLAIGVDGKKIKTAYMN